MDVAWFLFAGNLRRLSIREFALVIWLNCMNYPPNSKKMSKKTISEKTYWSELFGSMKDVQVSYVIKMKKKTINDPDLRIKYAFLALLYAVILPTSHNPRISEEHAEKIKDVYYFLSYMWVRFSFEMLMSSIKERDEVSQPPKTITLKGFVLKVIPSLTGVVEEASYYGSEGDRPGDDDFIDDYKRGREASIQATFGILILLARWSDDEDGLVVNLVKAINDGFSFSKSHFTGGATKADVNRLREEEKKNLVLDVLIHRTRFVSLSHYDQNLPKSSVFRDTKFVSHLAKSFAKFSKSFKKESFRFPSTLCAYLVGDCTIGEPTRFYFTFNFDKNHWVGVCLDCLASNVLVLYCNTSLRTEGMITNELCFISLMFPYLLRQAWKQPC